MPSKISLDDKQSAKEPPRDSVEPQPTSWRGSLPTLLQRARLTPQQLAPKEVLQLQRAIGNRAVGRLIARGTEQPLQREPLPEPENKTGLPDQLKNGIETLSGLALDDVRVHYNSLQPARLNALAYTRGAEIYIGPGHEKHLPHEAWHVTQQKQGRVKPTWQAKGVAINDNAMLETEAEVMGHKAAAEKSTPVSEVGRLSPAFGRQQASASPSTTTIQRVFNAIDDNGFQRFQWVPPATPSSSASPSGQAAPSPELYVRIVTERRNQYFIRVSDLNRGLAAFVDEAHQEAKPEIGLDIALAVARGQLEQKYVTRQAQPKSGNPMGRYAEDRTVLIVVRSREVFRQISEAQASGEVSDQALVITLPQARGFPPQLQWVTTYYLQSISPTEEYAVYEPAPLQSLTPTAEPPTIGLESKRRPIEHPLAIVPYGPTYDEAISIGKRELDRFASSNPRSRNQGEIMGASANEVARQMGLPEDPQATHYGYEWLHLRSYSLVGARQAQNKYNLVLGTWRVNTQMITVEEYVRELITRGIASDIEVDVDATSVPGKPLWFSRRITYRLTITIGDQELQREITFDPLSFRRPAYIERELDRFLIPLLYRRAPRGGGGSSAAPVPGAAAALASMTSLGGGGGSAFDIFDERREREYKRRIRESSAAAATFMPRSGGDAGAAAAAASTPVPLTDLRSSGGGGSSAAAAAAAALALASADVSSIDESQGVSSLLIGLDDESERDFKRSRARRSRRGGGGGGIRGESKAGKKKRKKPPVDAQGRVRGGGGDSSAVVGSGARASASMTDVGSSGGGGGGGGSSAAPVPAPTPDPIKEHEEKRKRRRR